MPEVHPMGENHNQSFQLSFHASLNRAGTSLRKVMGNQKWNSRFTRRTR